MQVSESGSAGSIRGADGWWQWPTVIGILALALRLVYLAEITSSPFFEAPAVDGKTYVDQALALAAGAWVGEPEPFWQPPLYPYLVGVLFWLRGEDYLLVGLVQASLGAASCVLLYILGQAVLPGRVAIWAGLTAAAYGPLIYFGGELLPTTLAVFLDLLLLVLLVRSPPNWPGPVLALVSGIVLGLSALAVANVLLLLPVLLCWLYSAPGSALVRDWRRPALLALGCVVVIGAVTVRNRVVGGEWVLISHNGGINFYIGNNPEYDRTVAIRPGFAWAMLVEEPVREAGVESRAGRSAFFLAKSWDFISSHPVDFARLTARKLYLFWHGDEIQRNLDPYFGRKFSSLLSALMWKQGLAFPFGVVAPLALFGLTCYWRTEAANRFQGRMLILVFLLYMVSVVAFFVTSRYRLPAVPIALLFAAYGAHRIFLAVEARQLRPLVIALSIVAGLALATNAGAGRMNMAGDGYTHFALGYSYERQGMETHALREYHTAQRLLPDHLDSALRLAALHSARKEHAAATAVYRSLLQQRPASSRARFLLGNTYLEAGRFEEAAAQYEEVAEQRPDWAGLQGRLGYAYLMSRRPLLAVQSYRQALELRPDSTVVRYQLARLYNEMDSLAAAAGQYQILLAAEPENALLHTLLANALIGDPIRDIGVGGNEHIERAEGHLRRALELDPNGTQARWSLAMLRARQGRYPESTSIFEELLELDPGDGLLHFCLANLYRRTGQPNRAEAAMDRYSSAVRDKRVRRRAEAELRDVIESMGIVGKVGG
jgi:tetratricopeptide (TPR) repeat protein